MNEDIHGHQDYDGPPPRSRRRCCHLGVAALRQKHYNVIGGNTMKTCTISFKAEEQLRDLLKQKAEEKHCSASTLITQYIYKGLEQEQTEKERYEQTLREVLNNPQWRETIVELLQGQLSI